MTLEYNANDIQPNTEPPFKATIFRRFIWIYALIATLLALTLGFIHHQYTQSLEDTMLSQEEAFVSSTTQALQKEMQIQLMLLQMSTRSKALVDFLENGTPDSRKGLETLFTNLAVTFYRYDQIRLIDLDGNERIRINYINPTVEVVSDKNLQNKKHTHYFQQGIKQPAGKVYISPMELNVEYGEVEFPHKPVIRFVTPIVNAKGETVGLMVMNYLATELLQNFRDQMELRISGQGMLIDPTGYWLSNHDRSNEWGGSLDDVDQKFENLYPTAWPVINKQQNGNFKSAEGIFRFVSINPFDLSSIGQYKAELAINLAVTAQSKQQNNWKLVIFLPYEIIYQNSFFYKPVGQVIIASLFIGLAAILLLLLIMAEQKRRQKQYDLFITNELNDLYENSPCGYHSLDKQGVVIKINQTELDWLGYSREEVLGKSFTDFLTPDSVEVFDRFLHNLKLDENVEGIEGVVLEIQCKDDHSFFVSTSATSILEKGHFAIARTSAFDITDRIQLENRLAHIANTDVLTEISNRRHFFMQASEIFKLGGDISLLMIDADHFKNINDTFGHDVGDEVLKFIAISLQKLLPEGAIVARIGGEEFAILVNYNLENTLQFAQNICKQVAKSKIVINEKLTVRVTLSIGTTQRIDNNDGIDELLKRSDVALYYAKTTGRNKVVQAENPPSTDS